MIRMNIWIPSPGETLADKIGVTGLDEIILNNMPIRWSKQAYVKGFGYKYISLKKDVNTFERMEISESIYKGVVEPSYKNLPGNMPTMLVASGIREEKTPCLRLIPRWERELASSENDM